MNSPIFRNPDKFQVLPYRDYLRENLPNGSEGYVIEDLDLVIRGFGPLYKTDQKGRCMLIELKYRNAFIGYAQKMTFGLIHELMRRGDPMGKRYLGYFVVQYDDEDWDRANFRINKIPVTKMEWLNFLKFKKPERVPDFPK